MLAAGIKTPVPLDELEIHLREEIMRQIKSGASSKAAFENSAMIFGEPNKLNSEFKKIRVPRSWRILAVMWFAGCLWSFNTLCDRVASNHVSVFENPPAFIFNSLVWFIYAAGLFGSFLLFRGSKYGVSIIRIIALLFFIACIAEILANFRAPGWQVWCGFCGIFSAISIWQLHLRKNLKSTA